MNPFTALNDTAKLVLTGLAILAVVAGLLFVRSLFDARAKLKELDRINAAIGRGDKAADAAAKKRAATSAEFFKKNADESHVLGKALSHADADFDDAARAEYYRVLNNALRGPQR